MTAYKCTQIFHRTGKKEKETHSGEYKRNVMARMCNGLGGSTEGKVKEAEMDRKRSEARAVECKKRKWSAGHGETHLQTQH